jgi:hypothetical protein
MEPKNFTNKYISGLRAAFFMRLCMLIKFNLFVFLYLLYSYVNAQCLAPFSDINNFVYVFDNGQSNYIENLPLQSYKVGKNVFAYTGQNTRLKVYYYGKVYPVVDNTPNYYVTDNWFLYQNFNVIKVLYNNEFKTLELNFSPGIDSLYYSDSLIAWTNRLGELNIFYNGEITILERTEIFRAKAGDNTFAYVDRNGNFKVFYHGKITTLEVYEPVNFLCNRDILVYIDQFGNYKYYYEGKVVETSTNQVPEYWIGEDFFAYVSILKQLIVYWKGEEITLMDDRPKVISVKENIIYWVDKGNNAWCFYKGKKYWLERYMPISFQMDNDIIVYQDLDGRLKAFYYGEIVQVSDQIVKKYNLFNEAVTYSLQPYETKVWCNKKTFTFN